MPNISIFNAPDLTIRPSEIGVESTAAAGRRLGVYGNQIAASREQTGALVGRGIREAGDAAYQQIEHHEISAGAAHGAELIATLNQSWNDTVKTALAKDPNDPTVAQKWREETLNPTLDQFRSGFMSQGGQQWAEHFVDQYREHAFTKSAADMSTLAGQAAVTNRLQTRNALTTAVFNDPSTLDFAKDALAHSLKGIVESNPNLSAADAARITGEETQKDLESVTKAAVMGAIVKGGDWQKIASNPKNAPYINAPEIQQFERAEKYYKHGAEVATKQELLLNKQIAEQNAHGAINDSWAKNVAVDDQGHVSINPQFVKDMVNLPFKNPNAPDAAEKAKTWINWAESQQKPPPRADNADTVNGLLQVASDPTKTLDDVKLAVAKADIAKGITPQTRSQINQLATDMRNINDPFLKNAMEVAKEQLSPKITGVPVDTSKYAAFYYDFIHNHYLPAKIAGALPPNALDMDDPKSMISQAITKATGGPRSTVPAAIGANGGITAPVPAFVPPANWMTNGKQYRDPQGKLYDLSGKPVNG